jgi:hypothetical protein
MLFLASALKASAHAFASDLDADRSAVSKTEKAMEKNRTGMGVTTTRLGVVRKMNKGK